MVAVQPEAIVTWSAAIGAAMLALVIGKLQGFSVVFGSFALQSAWIFVVYPVVIALYFTSYGLLRPKLSLLAVPFHSFAQFSAFNIAALFLQFPMASMNLPPIDKLLIQLDALVGGNWPMHFAWISSDPTIFQIVRVIYRSLLFQVPLVCVVIGLFDPRRLRIFVLANTVALSTTVILATLLPAAGAFGAFFDPPYPASMATQFVAVREGTLRVLDPEVITGIISFPSYHTILAVLIAFAFVGFPRLLPFIALYELAIIFTARSIGGHYYADIFAGFLIAGAANWASTRLLDQFDRRPISLSRFGQLRAQILGKVADRASVVRPKI